MTDEISKISIPSASELTNLAGELDRLLRDCAAAEEQLRSGAIPVAELNEANAALARIELVARDHFGVLTEAISLLEADK